jgi:cation:H+ antiporter
MAYGNAIGSIICNTALISAITVAIKPSRAERGPLLVPSIFFFATAIFYVCVAIFLKDFARWVGIVLLLAFVGYMITTFEDRIKTANYKRSNYERIKKAIGNHSFD